MARASQSPVPNLSGLPFVERGKPIRLRTARDHRNIMGEVIGLPVAESGGRGEVAVFGGPRAREYRLLFLEAFTIVQERRAQQAEALRLASTVARLRSALESLLPLAKIATNASIVHKRKARRALLENAGAALRFADGERESSNG